MSKTFTIPKPLQGPPCQRLSDNPLWPDLLAEIAANRQADREQAEREYPE